VGSPLLGIGDRIFYINETAKGYGYEEYSGNFLYPFVLKFVSLITSLFGQDQYSKLWNLIVILITSTFSIISLRFLKISSGLLFNKKVSDISCLLYIVNPYTYFYSLSGGITNYIIVGVSTILFLFCNAYKNGYRITESNNTIDIFFSSLICIYLSFLRPPGSIFAYVILIFFLKGSFKNIFHNKKNLLIKVINLGLLIFALIIVSYNFISVWDYMNSNIDIFSSETGNFFGYQRELLRDKLRLDNLDTFENIKSFFYYVLWKITEFVAGLSDIRDTHSAYTSDNLLPFFLRTFNGIFILFPLNIFSLLGLITSIKFILKYDIGILILASFFAIMPSIIGVAFSRFLIMFYPTFLIFSAKSINTFIEGIKINNE